MLAETLQTQNNLNRLDYRDFLFSVLSYLFLFLPLFLFFKWQGIKIVGDAIAYLQWADHLIINLSAGQGLLEATGKINPFYRVSICLLALIKYLGGESWPTAILLANAGFYALCAPSVYLLYRLCGGPRHWLVIIGAAIIPMGYPEVLYLGYIPLRDVPFAGAASLATVLIVWLASVYNNKISYFLSFMICLLLLIVRPNSLTFLLATTAIYLVFLAAKEENYILLLNYLIVFSLISVAVVILLLSYWFVNPFELYPEPFNKLMQQIREINQTGAIIIDHRDLYLSAPQSYWDYVRLLVLKFIYYFRYWNPVYSSGHQIYRHLYFGVLFVNFLFFAYQISAEGKSQKYIAKRLVIFTLCLAVAGALIHSVVVLAYEYRYQMIIFTGLWVMLLLNIAQVCRLVQRKYLTKSS